MFAMTLCASVWVVCLNLVPNWASHLLMVLLTGVVCCFGLPEQGRITKQPFRLCEFRARSRGELTGRRLLQQDWQLLKVTCSRYECNVTLVILVS